MDLELVRFIHKLDATIGALYQIGLGRRFLCFTLEDEFQEHKVPGETRIPSGRYGIKLRKAGGFHIRYAARFQQMHKGMLHLQDVPGFDFILIHTGNLTEDTAGCILVGDTALPSTDQIQGSEVAYRRIYPPIASHLTAGGEVWLTITDF